MEYGQERLYVPLEFAHLYTHGVLHELKDVSAVKPLTAVTIDCSSGNEDGIEELSPTGGTALRYDTITRAVAVRLNIGQHTRNRILP